MASSSSSSSSSAAEKETLFTKLDDWGILYIILNFVQYYFLYDDSTLEIVDLRPALYTKTSTGGRLIFTNK